MSLSNRHELLQAILFLPLNFPKRWRCIQKTKIDNIFLYTEAAWLLGRNTSPASTDSDRTLVLRRAGTQLDVCEHAIIKAGIPAAWHMLLLRWLTLGATHQPWLPIIPPRLITPRISNICYGLLLVPYILYCVCHSPH